MMKTLLTFLLFFIFNFGALGIGGLLMGGSPALNTWYNSQNLAPWTPPGWVFGAAWSSIMILFSIYMTLVWKKNPGKQNALIYFIHLILNIGWNPLFFDFHLVLAGLVVLVALFVVILLNHKKNFNWLDWHFLLILPYCVWLCIAFSLNFYVLLYN